MKEPPPPLSDNLTMPLVSFPPMAPSTLVARLAWGAEALGGKRALAAAAEISEAQLYRYLDADTAIPHDKLEALARAMGVDAGWLLTGWGEHVVRVNRPQPEFRGQLLQDLQEALDLLLVEYQQHFSPTVRSRLLRYLYEVLRRDEVLFNKNADLTKFNILQYISFLGELKTEAEFDILREAFDVLEYQGLSPHYATHHQLLTTWCNLLVRGMRGYYNSYAGQVYFERMGQTLPPDGVAELHGFVEKSIQILGQKSLNWLDFGCGNGRHLAHLHKHLPQVRLHGLELSDLAVELCNKLEKSERLPVGCVQQGDMRMAPYSSGQFDVVYSRLALQGLPYLPQTGLGAQEYIVEVKRILRPNGLLVATLPGGHNFNYKLPYLHFSKSLIKEIFSDWKVLDWQIKDETKLSTSVQNMPNSMKMLPNKELHQLILQKVEPKD